MQQQYMLNNAQDVYRKQAILTASPMELIVMLYDGCRKNLLLAQKSIVKKDAANTHKYLMKAQDIINELENSLDMNIELSNHLLSIYDFLLEELFDINVKKDDPARIDPLLEILSDLRETWQEVLTQQKGSLPALEG